MKNLLETGHTRKRDKITVEIVYLTKCHHFPGRRKHQFRARCYSGKQIANTKFECLVETIAKIITSKTDGEVPLASLDMLYRYGQIKLYPDTAKGCKFENCGGKRTGTNVFTTVLLETFFSHNYILIIRTQQTDNNFQT